MAEKINFKWISINAQGDGDTSLMKLVTSVESSSFSGLDMRKLRLFNGFEIYIKAL